MRLRRPGDLVAVPMSAEVLHEALSRHPDHFPLRKVQPMDRRELTFRRTGELTLCVLDVETAGLDLDADEIIELAVQHVVVDGQGRIVEAGAVRSWLEEPSRPIPPEVTEVTGLSFEDVRGRCISEGEAYSALTTADALVSHNARFDRAFVDRRFGISGQAWICSLADMDWKAAGFGYRKLECMLPKVGWRYEPHRAADDVSALVRLLDHELPGGDTVVRTLIRRASKPSWLVEAAGTPFSANATMKACGYAWDEVRRQRWRNVPEEEVEDEVLWLVNKVYAGKGRPKVTRQTWRERYSRTS